MKKIALNKDPFLAFSSWYHAAMENSESDPSAVSLATSTLCGKPSVRIVLLKAVMNNSFIFYTNYESRKGLELKENPYAALVAYWPKLYRQIRIEGSVEILTEAESQNYFATRPRARQIAAWASTQDALIPDYASLLEKYTTYEEKWKDRVIPCPSYWGGYRLIPDAYEFWQGETNRLHHRVAYTRQGAQWVMSCLAP